jgi:hypothetical protein
MRNTTAWLLLLTAVGLSGCKRNAAPVGLVPDPDHHLPERTDVEVADWLKLSRPELDRTFEDWRATATKLIDLGRGNRDSLLLLPKLRPVLTLPVFQNAKFSPRSGLSLPPYLEEGKRDSEVALHLARFGDIDGALLLADPADAALRKEIESLRAGRNYPVEWTRLVALAQFVSELRVANGEVQGAANLVQIHQQLRIVLDPKAAAGPLGGALLPGGRRALEAAGVAWTERLKTGFAGDVNAALAAWGDVPVPALSLVPGASREAVERVFPQSKELHSATALGTASARVFDLLALPLPADEMEGVAAFFDGGSKLAELTVLYRQRAGQIYPDPGYLAQRLAGYGITGQDAATAKGTLRQTFAGGALSYEVSLIPRGSAVGGFVQITDAKGPAVPSFLPADPLDFGAVHFDRTFDQDRLAVAPDQRSADAVSVTKAAEVRRIAPPAPEQGHTLELPGVASVLLRRLEGHDLLASLTFRWDRGQNATALAQLAVPLWSAYGAPHFEPTFDSGGGHLALVWEGAAMRYTLRLPHDEDQSPEFVAEDKRPASSTPDREKAAATFDRDQRAARLAAGKPIRRVPREFDEASAVKLGSLKAEVEAALPASQSLRKTAIDGGWSVFFMKPPPSTGAVTPQQLFVRFGPDDKVAELRLRYLERPVPKGDPTPTLLAHLTAGSGAPESVPSRWAGLWTDLPPQKPAPAAYRWKDDVTAMTLQRDGGGAEVTLRNLPADPAAGADLPPLRFCSRGVEGCVLGDARDAVLKRWKISDPTATRDGGLVLPMPKASPYEAVVAYFDNDKVVRVLSYHRLKPNFQVSEVPLALQESWGRDIDHLGCVRRQEVPGDGVLGGFGWHDDVTRVRTFSLDSDQGPRLNSEWREWPLPTVPAKGVAAAK